MNRPEDELAPTISHREKAVSEADEARLTQATKEYFEAVEAGQHPDREAILRRYPEIAQQLAACLDNIDFIHNVAPQLAEPAGKPARGSDQEIRPSLALGDFRIVRQIGKGGMGVVYEAEQLSLGRRMALKVLPFAAVLDPKQLQRFKNEAQAAASLKHPNIVGVHSVGCERGVHYYAMEFIEGQPLSEVIRDMRRVEGLEDGPPPGAGEADTKLADSLAAGRFQSEKPVSDPGDPTTAYQQAPSSEASVETARQPQAAISTERSTKSPAYFRSIAELGIQVAEALDHAHQHGVIHRDVKPSNVILDTEGKAWVTDFGLARVETGATLTISGDLLGTLRYMSPEQALAKRVVVDHRTDIYSLGVTLYELLTLRPAFSGQDRQELLRQIAFEEPRPPRRLNGAIPRELETIVLKATAKNPTERYATAQELADDLRRFLEDRPIQARRPSLQTRAVKWSRRHRLVIWAAVGLMLVTMMGSTLSTVLISRAYWREEAQRRRAEDERTRAEQNLLLAKKVVDEMLRGTARDLEVRGETTTARRIYDRASAFYAEFLKQMPDDPTVRHDAYMSLREVAYQQFMLGDQQEAERGYRLALATQLQLLREFPNNAEYRYHLGRIHLHLGRILRRQGQLREARGMFREAERATVRAEALGLTDDHGVYRVRALAHSLMGNHDKAVAALSRAIRLASSDPFWHSAYYRGRGTILLEMNKLDEAVADYTRAIQIRPQGISAYCGRALARAKMGEIHAALSDVAKLSAMDPSAPVAKHSLAWFLAACPDARLRKPKRAVELASEATNAVPDNGGSWITLGIAQYRAGDWKAAIDSLHKSTELHEDIAACSYLFLAMAHWRLGEETRARYWYHEAMEFENPGTGGSIYLLSASPPFDQMLSKFRDEAAELLGIQEQPALSDK